MGEATHQALGILGFCCALLPLWGRVPGPARVWAPHAVMAAVMAAMVGGGMGGGAGPLLAVPLLVAAVVVWRELPRRRERLHVLADLVAMLLLIALVGGGEAASAVSHGEAHGSGGGAWPVAPVAVFVFWLSVHAVCVTRSACGTPEAAPPRREPHLLDTLGGLGMVGSMAAMGVLLV